MGKFVIKGGNRLKGSIQPQGAKNEALQVICACLLTDEKVTISNIPEIVDVLNLIEILKKIGVKVEKETNNKYNFQANNININLLSEPIIRFVACIISDALGTMQRSRSSINTNTFSSAA